MTVKGITAIKLTLVYLGWKCYRGAVVASSFDLTSHCLGRRTGRCLEIFFDIIIARDFFSEKGKGKGKIEENEEEKMREEKGKEKDKGYCSWGT